MIENEDIMDKKLICPVHKKETRVFKVLKDRRTNLEITVYKCPDCSFLHWDMRGMKDETERD